MNNKIAFWEEDRFLSLTDIENKINEIAEEDLITPENNADKLKKFYEEVRPLTFLARYLNVESIKFTNDIKNSQSYDAMFKFLSGEEKKVEVTCAIDEKQLPLKTKHLKDYGYVSANVDIKYDKVKNKKVIKQLHFFMTGSADEKRKKILSLLKKAFEHKNKLNRETYKDSILLIVVDTDGTNTIKLCTYVNEKIHDIFKTEGIFDKIFLLSRNPSKYSNFFIEFPLKTISFNG